MEILQPLVDLVESNLLAATVLFVLALALLSIRFLRQFERWQVDRADRPTQRAGFFRRIWRLVRDPGIVLPTGLMVVLSTAMIRVYASLLFSAGPPNVEGLTAAASPPNHTPSAESVAVASVDTVPRAPDTPAAAKVTAPTSSPAGRESQCTEFGRETYNRGGECFDLPARPNVATLVPLGEEIEETPSPAVLAIRVLVDGTPETVLPVTPSDDPRFTILAMEFAQTIRYAPAKKGGKAVAAWMQQVFSPKTR